jgi:hypothetical protein
MSLRSRIRDLDRRIALAMLAVPLTACGGGTTSDGDGGGGQKDGQTFDVISTGCAPTSSPTCGCPPPTTITYVKCDPDAGPMDAGADAGCFATCGQACIAQNHPSNICTDQGTDGGLTTTTCQVGCGVGRRPDGLRQEHAGAGIGGYLAECAWLEAASVHAFTRLARELASLGAPRWLVAEARRAAKDEVRHARSMSRLARAHGARIPRVRVDRTRARSLEDIARENAVEGCVGETFGALVATWQATHATDPAVRRAMKRIAPDETRHAALSKAVAAFIEPKLSTAAMRRVEQARAEAARALATRQTEHVSKLTSFVGLPSGDAARAMAQALFS